MNNTTFAPTSRINGHAPTAIKKTRKTTLQKRATRPKRHEIDNLNRWATAYVALSAVMSMVLNAMANGHHAREGQVWMAYAMGALIPVLVLLLGRVAGLLHRRKKPRMSKCVGGIGVVLLLLSVFHCTESIGALTGSNWVLAAALAIGIDCGLVACEVVSVVED
jgi:drug/metabolite transporter (DMT)-like permease